MHHFLVFLIGLSYHFLFFKVSDDDESKNKHKGKDSAKFIASKWEQVDPEQLEKQGIDD